MNRDAMVDALSAERKRAFLLAPREEFARTRLPERVYAHAVRSIGEEYRSAIALASSLRRLRPVRRSRRTPAA